MKYDRHLTTLPWSDYELLDSGDNMKLERFGAVTVARPETQALWAKQEPELWKNASAVFAFRDKRGGWDVQKPIPEPWELAWGDTRFTATLTSFKHTGVFPEQAPNWKWLHARVSDISCPTSNVGHDMSDMLPKVLNLFGYTGIASVVAALAGAHVTHVDASKQSLDWAHDNARRSGVGEDKIRWLLDDALAFAKREARRGAKYDGIILDPPAFGRGAKGEVWKIEEALPELLETLKAIFSDKPGSFFLINGYAAGYAPRSFAQAIESVFGETDGECGELFIRESKSERVIPAGIYVRFVR
ncbi:MAG TPA: class I SAM-dependent methyltransferase [Candidatus Paceibacterota bacterium]|nr:class I SAM-dependent methyltransferase [Candidatus Paceibacterota bacterium]